MQLHTILLEKPFPFNQISVICRKMLLFIPIAASINISPQYTKPKKKRLRNFSALPSLPIIQRKVQTRECYMKSNPYPPHPSVALVCHLQPSFRSLIIPQQPTNDIHSNPHAISPQVFPPPWINTSAGCHSHLQRPQSLQLNPLQQNSQALYSLMFRSP